MKKEEIEKIIKQHENNIALANEYIDSDRHKAVAKKTICVCKQRIEELKKELETL